MATIKDVARLAGVSTTTVSHVMNKTRFVAENGTNQTGVTINKIPLQPESIDKLLN